MTSALYASVLASSILASGLMFADGIFMPAHAQSLTSGDLSAPTVPEDAKLLLIADELTYNQDKGVVVATGGVQIDYGSYKLIAKRVEYDQTSGRVKAFGSVELLDPSGHRVFADELDITDNFSDGFVKALRIETPEEAVITAATAERQNGAITVLRDGTYENCPNCDEVSKIAPRWKVKVRRIIRNEEAQTLRLEGPTFSIYDKPVLTLPSFTIPIDDGKAKSGFLGPTVSYSEKFGFSAKVPYYIAIAPNMDATVSVTGFSKTGFLSELEFRQKFENGNHSFRFAGAHQTNPDQVDNLNETNRGFIASKAEFDLNSKWKFGWDGMLQTDQNFARAYSLDGYSSSRQTNQIYLTGIGTTSYFDLHAYKFDIQNDTVGDTAEDEQAVVYPVLDYSRIYALGGDNNGQIKLTANAQYISRELQSTSSGRIDGVDGQNGRITTEVEWKKQIITGSGVVLTPILAARGDFHSFDVDTATAGLASGTDASRGMLTAGLEAKYPVVVQTANSQHIFEPVAQIFTRTDERLSGGLPNEDAQSFVFDTSNLFERDKFSGFDRMEGGTRANLGLRHTATYANGFSTQAIFGQSYHLAGLNSFAQTGLTGAGADSGLETSVSDYVGSFSLDTGNGLTLSAFGRFDKDDFDLERSTFSATYSDGLLSAGLSHARIRAQSGYGSTTDREEVSAYGSLQLNEEWRISASSIYDLDADNFTTSTAGAEYENSFSRVTGLYTHSHATASSEKDWKVEFMLNFKSFGRLEFDELVLE